MGTADYKRAAAEFRELRYDFRDFRIAHGVGTPQDHMEVYVFNFKLNVARFWMDLGWKKKDQHMKGLLPQMYDARA